MSRKGNMKKAEQLGMAIGTASNRLRKSILFHLLQETNKDICFQCGKKIDDIDNLSIEHKIPWLDSENPVELFFDLNNIAFSHLSCNSGASRQTKPEIAKHGQDGATLYRKGCRCRLCKDAQARRKRESSRRDRLK